MENKEIKNQSKERNTFELNDDCCFMCCIHDPFSCVLYKHSTSPTILRFVSNMENY